MATSLFAASQASAALRRRRAFSAPTISSGSPSSPLDFAFTSQKTTSAAAARDDVELVAGDPDVRREDAVPAQAVVPDRAALGPRSDRAGATPR